jgi:DNA-binding CsgD family transcriptional regulator/tetratricopeptide (TPR) repeat protein
MSIRVVSPVLVGRRTELARLTAGLDAATGGDPRILLVGGEAGVGKTRLVEELAARAALGGARVLAGGCVEIAGEGLPFAPLVDALRVLVRTTPAAELDGLLGSARGELARLLPELDPAASPRPPGDSDRARLFELLLGLAGRLAAAQPLVLIFEDLHWADRSTRDLVMFLARTLRHGAVLLVVTYRSDEVHRSHPLRPLLAELDRVRAVERVELERFDRDEVGEQLGAILGETPEPDLVDGVFTRSEGNAFLVEEVLGAVRAGEECGLTPSLRDVLLARVGQLGDRTQHVLRVAAAGGRRVQHRLLEEVAGVPQDELFDSLREAVDRNVLTSTASSTAGDGGYAFRHALVREAIHTDTLPGELVRLHTRYAEALERDPTLAAGVSEVAHHWYYAHDLPRALAADVAAARQAACAYAHAEAQRHLERALAVWPRVPDAAERTALDQVGLLELTAAAAQSAGDDERALALAEEALRAVDRETEPIRAALLLERRARLLRNLGREGGLEALSEAVDLVPAEPPTAERALVVGSLASALMLGDRPTESRVLAEEAVRVARLVGAQREEARSLTTLGGDLVAVGDVDGGLAALRTALELAAESGDDDAALRAHTNLADALEGVGRLDEAAEVAEAGAARARLIGLGRTTGAFLTGNRTLPLLRRGRWGEAERLIVATLEENPPGVQAIYLHTLSAELAAARGQWARAAEGHRAARRLLSRNYVSGQYTLPLTRLEIEIARGAGELERAVDVAAAALATPPPATLWRYAWPLVWAGVRAGADAADRARDLGTSSAYPERAAEFAAWAAGLPAPFAAQRAHRAMTAGELRRAEGSAGTGDWADAVREWRAAGEPHPLAYALLRLAEAEVATGDRAAAGAALAEAVHLADELGAAPLAVDGRALARRARLALDDDVAAGPEEEPGADDVARLGLTPRELEVLRLVAAGRSNAEIATVLFISPKTASVHVSNILAKLGVPSRVGAAAVAHRLRLFETSA